MKVAVLYLASGTVSQSHGEEFALSYMRHRSGCAHQLHILHMNGDDRSDAKLGGLDATHWTQPGLTIDLNAYREAVGRIHADMYLFLNSYSTIESSDWLRHFVDAACEDDVGLVGATGSHQTLREADLWTRPKLPPIKHARREVALRREIRRFRRGFPHFPNAHIRTNGFLITAATLAQIDWPHVEDKTAAMLFESGRRGLSAQVRSAGKKLVVVGRDGIGYRSDTWETSRTFRNGGQVNLVVADNQTRAYLAADSDLRAYLEASAWRGDRLEHNRAAASWINSFGAGLDYRD